MRSIKITKTVNFLIVFLILNGCRIQKCACCKEDAILRSTNPAFSNMEFVSVPIFVGQQTSSGQNNGTFVGYLIGKNYGIYSIFFSSKMELMNYSNMLFRSLLEKEYLYLSSIDMSLIKPYLIDSATSISTLNSVTKESLKRLTTRLGKNEIKDSCGYIYKKDMCTILILLNNGYNVTLDDYSGNIIFTNFCD